MAKRNPLPLCNASRASLARIEAVFFDIDDTFSGGRHGQPQIRAEAYEALWQMKEAGLIVVPVTGRPAGWCDMIARMWPVSAVVGENGAFYCHIDSTKKPPRLVKTYLESASIRKRNAAKLAKLRQAIPKSFPGARFASDQLYREFDLAVDYCEDVKRWPDAKVQKLISFCRAKGAAAKLSSIHVNTWFGDYDKLTCVRRILSRHFKFRPGDENKKVVYIGDSPNDEPFFANLQFTVGVANVRAFLDRPGPNAMKCGPAFVTESESGLGFAEFARKLLDAK